MLPGDDPRFVSTGECARAIGVNVRTLQKWVTAGLIDPDFRTIGGHMRWDVDRVKSVLMRGLPRARQQNEEQ